MKRGTSDTTGEHTPTVNRGVELQIIDVWYGALIYDLALVRTTILKIKKDKKIDGGVREDGRHGVSHLLKSVPEKKQGHHHNDFY